LPERLHGNFSTISNNQTTKMVQIATVTQTETTKNQLISISSLPFFRKHQPKTQPQLMSTDFGRNYQKEYSIQNLNYTQTNILFG